MPRATWLADVLTDAGLKLKPLTGWETRGSTLFTPRGVILHHTVTKPDRPDVEVDKWMGVTGRPPGAPAPLCNYSTNRDGSVSLIAAGTANHGGVGVWKGTSGNRFWFGDEMKNIGTKTEPWAAPQLESARIAAAAILRQIGSDASWVCGHKEYAPTRKTDPHTLNMSAERLLIADLLNPSQEEDDMYGPCKEGDTGVTVEAWQRVMQRISGFAPKAWGTFGSDTSIELQRLTGPGNNIGPTEGALLLELVGGSDAGGLTEAQVKAIVNGSQIVAG